MINPEINSLPLLAAASNVDYVVGALIVDKQGRIYVQRRTLNRKLFPGCWDIVGGHVEAGETLEDALKREVEEETGWVLQNVGLLIKEFRWEAEEYGVIKKKVEFDFFVEVKGDLSSPRLEADKHDKYHWIAPDEINMLLNERSTNDTFIFDVVKEAFTILKGNIG